MNRFNDVRSLLVGLTVATGLVFLISGCSPQQHFYLTSKGRENAHYLNKGLQIDYPDTQVPSTPEVCQAAAPFTLSNPNPTEIWDMSLEEAIRMALANSKVIRSLNSVSFSAQGVGGVPSMLLSNPNAVGTVYDPALVESDPRYGVEAALSAFDAQYQGYLGWKKTDELQNRLQGNGNLATSQTDTLAFQNTIQKIGIDGTKYYVSNDNFYNWDNSLHGNIEGNKKWPSSWAAYIEGGIVHPLLQGNGMQFNRIAGPGGSAGFYNGALIARINADTSLTDFEINARNLVAQVEEAYWNLYYSYHYLESVKAGRDSALVTWKQINAFYQHGHPRGTAKNEAQSRQTYYQFRGQVESAQSNLFKSENMLRYILGLATTDGRLIRPTDEPTIAPLQLDWNNIVCEALIRSPELRKQKWVVKQRELELIAAKNYLLPRVDLVANYRINGLGEQLIAPDGTRSNAYGNMMSGDHANWTLGIQANVPFGFRKELAGVRNAQLNLAKARSILQEQEHELTFQLSDSFRELSRHYQLSKTNLNDRIAAQAELEATNSAFEAGTTTIDQVLDAMRRLATSEVSYYRSLVDYNVAITTLHQRKGSLLEYNNVGLSEGPWPNKAYFDARKQARKRDASTFLNYGFTKPSVVSRSQHAQYQNGYNYSSNNSYEINTSGEVVIPASPSVDNGMSIEAPKRPESERTIIETTPVSTNVPAASQLIAPAVNVGNPQTQAVQASYSQAAKPAANNRYVQGNAALPKF
ncbi:MAG: TolC family protein [Planctomycetaceae bacterium]|jgi:outer membrane protein TolC|nr:TolC family protein [Planctomycetaceae bacterium]